MSLGLVENHCWGQLTLLIKQGLINMGSTFFRFSVRLSGSELRGPWAFPVFQVAKELEALRRPKRDPMGRDGGKVTARMAVSEVFCPPFGCRLTFRPNKHLQVSFSEVGQGVRNAAGLRKSLIRACDLEARIDTQKRADASLNFRNGGEGHLLIGASQSAEPG